jgi:hypothetical protein
MHPAPISQRPRRQLRSSPPHPRISSFRASTIRICTLSRLGAAWIGRLATSGAGFGTTILVRAVGPLLAGVIGDGMTRGGHGVDQVNQLARVPRAGPGRLGSRTDSPKVTSARITMSPMTENTTW